MKKTKKEIKQLKINAANTVWLEYDVVNELKTRVIEDSARGTREHPICWKCDKNAHNITDWQNGDKDFRYRLEIEVNFENPYEKIYIGFLCQTHANLNKEKNQKISEKHGSKTYKILIRKLKLKYVKTLGFKTVKAYETEREKTLALKRAKANGFNTIADYDRYINLKKAKANGFESIADYDRHINLKKAKKNGFKTIADYDNSKHPYRKHRKNYCENSDGRLDYGYDCKAEIHHNYQLDVDHIDGDPSNNSEENLMTLCKNCHADKTYREKDGRSPGRKALGIKY